MSSKSRPIEYGCLLLEPKHRGSPVRSGAPHVLVPTPCWSWSGFSSSSKTTGVRPPSIHRESNTRATGLPCQAATAALHCLSDAEIRIRDTMSNSSSSLSGLEGDVARYFDKLSVRGKIIAEYIWVGGTGSDLRSKSRVLNFRPQSVEDLPLSHFDGSFTGQVCLR